MDTTFRVCIDACDAYGVDCVAATYSTTTSVCNFYSAGSPDTTSALPSTIMAAVRQTWQRPPGGYYGLSGV